MILLQDNNMSLEIPKNEQYTVLRDSITGVYFFICGKELLTLKDARKCISDWMVKRERETGKDPHPSLPRRVFFDITEDGSLKRRQ